MQQQSATTTPIEPRKITVKSALRASQAPILMTLIFHGSLGAYRKDGCRILG